MLYIFGLMLTGLCTNYITAWAGRDRGLIATSFIAWPIFVLCGAFIGIVLLVKNTVYIFKACFRYILTTIKE
jgi:hypothetical protein